MTVFPNLETALLCLPSLFEAVTGEIRRRFSTLEKSTKKTKNLVSPRLGYGTSLDKAEAASNRKSHTYTLISQSRQKAWPKLGAQRLGGGREQGRDHFQNLDTGGGSGMDFVGLPRSIRREEAEKVRGS